MLPLAPNRARDGDQSRGPVRLAREVDPKLIDAAVAAVLSAAALAIALGRPTGDGGFRAEDLPGVVLVLLQTVPLTFRRASPLGVLVVINAALVAHAALGYEVDQAGTFGSLTGEGDRRAARVVRGTRPR